MFFFYQFKVSKLKRWCISMLMQRRQQKYIFLISFNNHRAYIPNVHTYITSGKVEVRLWCSLASWPKKDFEADSTASRALKVAFTVLQQRSHWACKALKALASPDFFRRVQQKVGQCFNCGWQWGAEFAICFTPVGFLWIVTVVTFSMKNDQRNVSWIRIFWSVYC